MGTIKQGILGGFSGKVGAVIGSFWKGIAYMRGIAQSIHDAKSEKQIKARAKFALVVKTLMKLQGFLNVGFHNSAEKMTELDAAIKKNYNNMIGGTWPNLEVYYDKIEVSTGNLDLPYNPTASVDSGVIGVTWTDNSGIGKALDSDMAMVLAYNPSKEQAVYNLAAGARSTRQASLTVPSAWNGDNVEVWFAMQSKDGSKTSESMYMGSLSV